jgi:hypothetical protein
MQRPQPRLSLFPEDLSEDLTVSRCSALLISICADLALSEQTKYDALALLVGARRARSGGVTFRGGPEVLPSALGQTALSKLTRFATADRSLPLLQEEVFDVHLLLFVGELLALQPLDGFLGASVALSRRAPGTVLTAPPGVHLHRGRIVRRAQVLGYVVAVFATKKYLQFTGTYFAFLRRR